MPYFSIETNQALENAATREITKKASAFIAGLLGKPESFVMICIRPGSAMTFGGSDEPAAFVRLKSIGLAVERCREFSEKICGFVDQWLGVPKNRVFIDFTDLARSRFGWDGKTF